MNAALFYENPNPKEYISLVPTSAHSGDGMGNLIALLCHYSQTFLAKRVAVTDDLQATVMEVKALPGLGEFYAVLSKLGDKQYQISCGDNYKKGFTNCTSIIL